MTVSNTSVLGGLTILGGIINLIVDGMQHNGITTVGISVAATAVTGGIGLILAKDANVSNSPAPLLVAQKVIPKVETAAEPIVDPKA